MRWWLVIFALVFVAGCGSEKTGGLAERSAELRGESFLVPLFQEAEAKTGVPAALLATVAYLETRLSTKPRTSSQGHAPPTYGVMGIGTGGLVSLEQAAARAGISPDECANDTEENIRAAALVLASRGITSAERRDALVAYGGDVLAQSVQRLLATGWKSSDDSGLSIEVVGSGVVDEDGIGTVQQAIGFPGSIWNPAVGYSTAWRGPDQINYVVIHTTQGSYGGTINWFKNPVAEASSHYVVRSSDGEITQMVDDKDIAWHDACFNSESIGIEHEGFVDDPGTWYTEAMYGASAKLTAWLCDAYGIPKDHSHIMGHGEAPDCSDHTDPGWGWNWDHYLQLVQSGGLTSSNCTTGEAQGCGNYGCGCVDHQCNGVFCPGTGCTAQQTADCGAFGCGCVDGQCNGVFCPGTGCTAKETNDCAAYGCGCVDHKCNGGFCDGNGCTAREDMDCGAYACGCTDHKCGGILCPGVSCTAKQTLDCEKQGLSCVDHACKDESPAGDAGTGEGGAAGTSSASGGGTGWSGNGGTGVKPSGDDDELPGKPDTDAVEGSCSCRTAGAPASGSALWLLGIVALVFLRRKPVAVVVMGFALFGCATGEAERRCELPPNEPAIAMTSEALSSIDCNEHGDTGYSQGSPFPITVVTVDGKPVETATANAYYVMAQAAAAAGVNIQIVSGFRTMSEQEYFYGCYVNCNCNSCNQAAKPGYSNHQSGHALDLNTSAGGVYGWLDANAWVYGFSETVAGEPWHWEWWGGGPGGGPCGLTAQNCTSKESQDCGAYGCGCVDHQCNGVFCPGTGCTAQQHADCGAFGCGCVDGSCNGVFCDGTGCTAKETNDCAAYGCGCVDHKCNGGACEGTGCTAKDDLNCGNYGCGCADHKCGGGFCPGTACTLKQTLDCEAKGQTCQDHACVDAPASGGAGGQPSETGGAGGSTESGGNSGTEAGGSGWGSGGSGITSGAAGANADEKPDTADVDGSCSCRAGSHSANGISALAFLALVAVLQRRRCSGSSRSSTRASTPRAR